MHVVVSSLFMQITLPFPVVYFVQSLSSEGFADTEVVKGWGAAAALVSEIGALSHSV